MRGPAPQEPALREQVLWEPDARPTAYRHQEAHRLTDPLPLPLPPSPLPPPLAALQHRGYPTWLPPLPPLPLLPLATWRRCHSPWLHRLLVTAPQRRR